MFVYVDYLDHMLSGKVPIDILQNRLRFDLLVFFNDILCLSVPACVKEEQTTKLLMELTLFWENNRIVLQLDKRHKKNPFLYFANRIRTLEKSMPEERLVNHFEFVAYNDSRTKEFYSTYLKQVVMANPNRLFVKKKHDTDSLFRKNTISIIEYQYDNICKAMGANESIVFTGIVNRILSFALDKGTLFQRSVIENEIKNEFKCKGYEQQVVEFILDKSFAIANAKTNDSYPISMISNQLTGYWLMSLLSVSYRRLYHRICELSWTDIFSLTNDSDWRMLIEYINAFIFAFQKQHEYKQDTSIQLCVRNLSNRVSVLRLLLFLKKQSIDFLQNKLVERGLIAESYNIELASELLQSFINGRSGPLIDSVLAIDSTAKRIFGKIDTEEKFGYLAKLGREQKNKTYIIQL